MVDDKPPDDGFADGDKLAHGDPDAYEELWRTYGARLQALARTRLPQQLQQRVGAEDVVQSACRTFFRRMQGGQLHLEDSENLWNLLCAITINKARMQARYHGRQRRSVRRETRMNQKAVDGEPRNLEPADGGPLPDDLAVFSEELQRLLGALDGEEQQVVQWKLEDRSNTEIAASLDCTDRTVRRMLERIRGKLKRQLVASWDDPD